MWRCQRWFRHPVTDGISVVNSRPSNPVCWILAYGWLAGERAPWQLSLPFLWWERRSDSISYVTLLCFYQVHSGLSDQKSDVREDFERSGEEKSPFLLRILHPRFNGKNQNQNGDQARRKGRASWVGSLRPDGRWEKTGKRGGFAWTTAAREHNCGHGGEHGPALSESNHTLQEGLFGCKSSAFHLPVWFPFMTSPGSPFKSSWTLRSCIPVSRHSGLIKMWNSPSVWTKRTRLIRSAWSREWNPIHIIEISSLPHSDPREFNMHYR